MRLFRELTRKPWLTAHEAVGGVPAAFVLPTARVGLRVFLVVVSVVFTLLLIAYADRITHASWRSLPEPWLLWLNTALLILSSVAMQWARNGAAHRRMDGVRNGLYAGGGFAFAFLAGQLAAWQQLVDLGYFANTNPANAFFYLLTALHGVHLMGGLVAWWRSTARVRRGAEIAELRLGVELCAVYWHYLLLVWLILFAFLLFT